MKKLIVLLSALLISQAALASKWVPQTKEEHSKVWKTILSLDIEGTEKLLESGLHPDLSGGYEPELSDRGGIGKSPIINTISGFEAEDFDKVLKMVKLFLKHGADINLVPWKSKRFIPHTAYALIPEGECYDYKNEPEYKMAKFLVDNGYKATSGNFMSSGEWATALTSQAGCGPIAGLLLGNGADPAERNCAVYQRVRESYVDEGGAEADREFQEEGYPPHSLNYFREAVIAKYGQGKPGFNPDKFCGL